MNTGFMAFHMFRYLFFISNCIQDIVFKLSFEFSLQGEYLNIVPTHFIYNTIRNCQTLWQWFLF